MLTRHQTFLKAACAAVVMGAITMPARATLYDLSYTLGNGQVLTALLAGNLQADLNTVLVDGVLDFAALDGTAGPALPVLYGYDFALAQPTSPIPAVTLDGSFLDLLACDDAVCNSGVGFAVGNLTASAFGAVYAGGSAFGNTFEPFNAANFSLQVSAVPEPGSLPLWAGGALTLLCWGCRRAPRRLGPQASASSRSPFAH